MELRISTTVLFLCSALLSSVSADNIAMASVPSAAYRLPSIFALNDGKPFYLDKDPVTGAVDFTAGGKEVSEPSVAETSSITSAATAEDEDVEELEEEEGRPSSPLAPINRGGASAHQPIKAAPVTEEVDEDEPPPSSNPPVTQTIPKDQIDRKDSVPTKTSGGRPNDIQEADGDNPYFHQFLNLNVHEYGDRIPGASSIRDDPYSFANLGKWASPLEREYKFPLISSSYANTKVQGVGGSYYYGDKGSQSSKDKEKEKYKPGYAPSTTRRPTPSYYHEKDDDDHYYGKPSSHSSTSAEEEEEEEEDPKYHGQGSSHYYDDKDSANEEEGEGEEEGESIDELVEEVSDPKRPPVHPKRPEPPKRDPPKKTHKEEEAEEEDSYHEERPSYYGGGGFGGRPVGDRPRPTQQQNTYFYGHHDEDEEEEEQEGPLRKPVNFQGSHAGEEDRPRPSQAEGEEVDEEEEEEEGGESNVEERPPPPKPSLSYLGFENDYDKEPFKGFGETAQGSQKVNKPGNNHGYQGHPQEFHVDGYFASSDREGPQRKPSKEAISGDDSSVDEKRPNEGQKEDEEEDSETKPFETRRPYSPPQIVQFTPAQSTHIPTERPQRPSSQPTLAPSTSSLPPRDFHKPTYPSPYGIEEPFRPIYGPEETESFGRPLQAYPHPPNKNQILPPSIRPPSSARPPYQPTPGSEQRPSQFYDSYFPLRPLNANDVYQKKKDSSTPESILKEPTASTYKPTYDSKTKKPIEQISSPWKADASESSGSASPKPTQEIPKEANKEQIKPLTTNEESKKPTLPPPPFREVVGIGSVGEPEYIKPTQQPSYGPFRFPDHDYIPQRPSSQLPLFLPRPTANSGVATNSNPPPPPFGAIPPNIQRPVLPPPHSPNIRPQGIENPPPYHPQRPQGVAGAVPPPPPRGSPPPRRWEEGRPVYVNPNARPQPPPQSFLHRPRPQEQPALGPQQSGNHPYKFVSRKPGQEPVLMGSAPNAVFGNEKKPSAPTNGPKAQVPDPNLPNILPQFRPNAKISYSTIQREKGPYSPPPPPAQFGPIQRVSNIPERPIRPAPSFYENLQPPPLPSNLKVHRVHGGGIAEIPYGPPQIYPFGPGGSPPVGRRSGPQHQARVGEEDEDNSSDNNRKRPQVTTLQMIRNGFMDQQAARHPIVSVEDFELKSTANPTTEIEANPTIYITPEDGSKSAVLSVDSSASEDHPVFVVYPVSDTSFQEDGVVIGTRGSQKPLPPSSIASDEPPPSVLPTRPNSVNSDFPYPLLRPLSNSPVKPEQAVTGPVYTLVQEEGPNDHIKENADSNIIPYIQDYSPYATKKPLLNNEGSTTTVTETTSTATPSPTTTTPTPEKSTTRPPVSIVNASAWQPDSEVEVSASMHTASSGVPGNHRPLVEEKPKIPVPSPLNFQAPFLASENIERSPSAGWSAVGGSSAVLGSNEAIPSISRSEPNSFSTTPNAKDNDSGDGTKFDFDNFKPQLFGGFKPIYSVSGDDEGDFKYPTVTTERQER
ncbi:hypothetical protein J437_LFUL002716 [Ladona fulva]|uniref:Enamelin n=1 Tax=Ladona fulva TaxID=123851 RepID=A0A8K0K0Y7_LADFU|nr:hypothetical protein J437_LFUL002716 [Ladona fulva]